METRSTRFRPAYMLDRETGPALWLAAQLWLVHATGIQTDNRFSFVEQVMPGGLGPPAHRHPYSIEGFYILEGTLTFHVDGQTMRAEAGTLLHLPRMIPHAFTIDSKESRVLNWYAPAGNEIQLIALAQAALERRMPTMKESMPPKTDELNRILSRQYGSVAVNALPFSGPPQADQLDVPPNGWHIGHAKMAGPTDGATFDAFGLHWRLLAAGVDTHDDYDLFEVKASAGAGMPRRIIGADEAIYVIEGSLHFESDGVTQTGGIGTFFYAPEGTMLRWQAAESARFLVFHYPGGFDRAVAGGRGEDALIMTWLESTGTRFLESVPLTAAMLGDAPRSGR